MTSEKERQNLSKLLQLIRENPDLPVLPLVDREILGDDSIGSWWLGSLKTAEIDEFVVSNGADEFTDTMKRIRYIFLKSRDKVSDTLKCFLSEDEYLSLTTEDSRKRYEELPWQKAIVVFITTPDFEGDEP